jgi:hypothetical protein
VREIANLFLRDETSQADVECAGIKLFIKMYQGKEGDTLNGLRYVRYMNALASSERSIRPETLPPTESAARFHSLAASILTSTNVESPCVTHDIKSRTVWMEAT